MACGCGVGVRVAGLGRLACWGGLAVGLGGLFGWILACWCVTIGRIMARRLLFGLWGGMIRRGWVGLAAVWSFRLAVGLGEGWGVRVGGWGLTLLGGSQISYLSLPITLRYLLPFVSFRYHECYLG